MYSNTASFLFSRKYVQHTDPRVVSNQLSLPFSYLCNTMPFVGLKFSVSFVMFIHHPSIE